MRYVYNKIIVIEVEFIYFRDNNLTECWTNKGFYSFLESNTN